MEKWKTIANGGTAPYSYAWSNSATTTTITGIIAGNYTITITDNNGCTDTDNGTVSEPTLMVASTVVDNNTSCGNSNGGATAQCNWWHISLYFIHGVMLLQQLLLPTLQQELIL